MYLVDNVGRRILLLASFTCCSISSILLIVSLELQVCNLEYQIWGEVESWVSAQGWVVVVIVFHNLCKEVPCPSSSRSKIWLLPTHLAAKLFFSDSWTVKGSFTQPQACPFLLFLGWEETTRIWKLLLVPHLQQKSTELCSPTQELRKRTRKEKICSWLA